MFILLAESRRVAQIEKVIKKCFVKKSLKRVYEVTVLITIEQLLFTKSIRKYYLHNYFVS